MSNEAPMRVRLLVSVPESRTYRYDTVLPADWYLDSRFSGLKEYTQHRLLPAIYAGLGSWCLQFPEGATGVTADVLTLREMLADG
ncbi:hypothetical protein [Streptomyces sp. 061-3]|uniref:hypothetical protein n=1 Tax=Streptomyces sp. 061-3 TaxID=2789268 RepID=UPI0039810074